MAQTGQDAEVYRGAAREIEVEVFDEAGEPLPLDGIPLYYRVAVRTPGVPGGMTTLLSVDEVAVEGHVARIVITREQSLTLPVRTLTHELYTTDGDESQVDDAVLMRGSLRVRPALIAEHA